MAVEKKFFLQLEKAFVIRDRQGNLDKPWYVEFYLDGKRIKKWGDINHYSSLKGRVEAAKRLRQELIAKYTKSIIQDQMTDREYLLETLEQKSYEKRWRVKTLRGHKSMLNTFFNFIKKDNFKSLI